MTDTKKDRYYLDASAFFARHPHLDKQDPRFEYASDRREYVESLAASSPAPKAPPAAPASPNEAIHPAWRWAMQRHGLTVF